MFTTLRTRPNWIARLGDVSTAGLHAPFAKDHDGKQRDVYLWPPCPQQVKIWRLKNIIAQGYLCLGLPLARCCSACFMDLLLRAGWQLVQWGSEIAGETAVAAARLPPTCKEALAHSVVVCAGGDPRYFAPGWGPLCVCWGWLCLGAVLGACAVLLILLAHQVGRRPAESPAWLTAAREVLDCFAEGGLSELRGLASQTGLSAEELLYRLLREAASGSTTSRADTRGLGYARQEPPRIGGPVAEGGAGRRINRRDAPGRRGACLVNPWASQASQRS